MPERRSLCWRLNWYRQSELEGALLLGRMVRHVTDPYLVGRLTQHCADEARHAWLWKRTLETLGLPSVRIRRSYQSFYLDEISTPRTPDRGARADARLRAPGSSTFHGRTGPARPAGPGAPDIPRLLRDEQEHLDWICGWLAGQPAARRDSGSVSQRRRARGSTAHSVSGAALGHRGPGGGAD